MRRLSQRMGRWRWLHTFIYSAQYVVITTVMSFPLTVYQGFVREHSYNLATQTFGAWMGDQFTSLLVGVLIGSIGLNDNLLRRASSEEIEAVLAHEMGYYVLHHGAKLIINFGLVLAFGFAFVAWVFNHALRLSEYRKISPGPLERFVFYDHPSGRDRVHMAMLWKSVHQESEPRSRKK